MRKSVMAVLTAIALLFGVGLTTAPTASAATITETYPCTTDHTDARGIWYGSCDGYWYAGTPGSRTARVYADSLQYWPDGTRQTRFHQVTSTDGRKKVFEWRCAFDDGTTSGLKGTTTVGGGLANTFIWGGSGLELSCGNQSGVEINIKATYGSSVYTTKVWIQAPKSLYAKKHHGDQVTA
jgi:hypothetical protein